jgi:hypothetical protein
MSAIREAAMELKLGCKAIPGYVAGYSGFEITYEDPADLISLGAMYQTNLNKY